MKQRPLSFGEKYPKLLFLLFSIVIAFVLLLEKDFAPFQAVLFSLGYVGTFAAGFLYAYSFTAIPAAAIFLLLAREQNILLAGLIAGIGAIMGDFLFFKLMRGSFSQELHRLSQEKTIAAICRPFQKFRRYVLLVLASFIISSPLPTEIGIVMLSSIKEMTTKRFLAVTYVLHTVGILIILLIGKTL